MSDITLPEFILARVADWEALARVATPGPWWKDDDVAPHYGEHGWYVRGCPAGETEDSAQGRADAMFIATHDPARVLAQCAAYRSIVDEASELLALNEGTSVWMAAAAHAKRTLRHLASIWADHPDFRPEWRL